MHSVLCTRVSTLHVSKSPTECVFCPLDGKSKMKEVRSRGAEEYKEMGRDTMAHWVYLSMCDGLR